MDVRDRESILNDLRNRDDEIRRLAVERATTLPAEEALGVLLEGLGDPSWRVRKAAIERLATSRDPSRAVASLVTALADGENPGRRNAALEALMRCGSVAVAVLIEASLDPDIDVRKQVVDALAGIGDPRSSARLCELLHDEDPNVRAAAADALGQVSDLETAPALLRSAREDRARLVQLSALRALERMESPVPIGELVGMLGDAVLRSALYGLLGASDDPQAEEWLLKGLREGIRSNREAAMEALVRSASRTERADGSPLVARIREIAGDDRALVTDAVERLAEAPLPRRLVIVQFLSLLADPDTVAPLLEVGVEEILLEPVLASLENFGTSVEPAVEATFEQLSPPARRLAAELLGRTGGGVGERVLGRAMASDDPELKAASARALGRCGAVGALPTLVRELELAADDDLDEDVLSSLSNAVVAVTACVDAASAAAGDRAMELLAERLPGASDAFRALAARIMGEIGRPEDAQRIGLLMSDPSERVRRAAVESLGRIARGAPPEPLHLALADESPLVRIGAAAALAASGGDQALQDLSHLSRDDDERVRAAAIRALGACATHEGDPAPHAVLDRLAEALAEEGRVALSALESLNRIGGEPAVHMAGGLLQSDDPELVRAAVECLGRHASPDEMLELFPLLSHAEWSVRAGVAQVLADRANERAVPPLLRRLEVELDEFVRTLILAALARLER